MSFILAGIVAIVFAIILDNQNKKAKNETDYYSMSYRQGYWDGVKASEAGQVSTKMREQPPAAQPATPTIFAPLTQHVSEPTPAPSQPEAAMQPSLYVYAASNETAEEHSARTNRQTINIALYVASLLLVSGIILLAQTVGLDNTLKFVLVWLMIAVYYVAGLVLYQRVPLVKPAAVAFIGTALAGVPVAGIVMYTLVSHNAALCWLATSLLGAVLYSYATVKIKSQSLAYISLLSFFIFLCSLPAVAHAQLMWYYVVMIAFGSVLTILAQYKFAWVPRAFAQPVATSSPIIVPLALMASFVSFPFMKAGEYTAVFAAATVYYLAQAVVSRSTGWRLVSWVAARSLAMLTITSLVAAFTNSSLVAISIALMGAAFVNIVMSAAYLTPKVRAINHHEIMLWVGFAATMVACLLVGDVENRGHAFVLVIHLVTMTITSAGIAWYLSRSELLWPAFAALTALPVVYGLFVARPALNQHIILLLYAGFVSALVALRGTKRHGLAAQSLTLLYTAITTWLIAMVLASIGLSAGWWAGVMVLVAAVCYLVMLVERISAFMMIGNGMVLLAGWLVTRQLQMSETSSLVLLSYVHMIATVGASEWLTKHLSMRNNITRMSLFSATTYSAFLGVLMIFFGETDQQRAIGWLPFVGVLYWAYWRTKQLSVLVGGHLTLTVLLMLIARATGLAWLQTVTVVAWLMLVGLLLPTYVRPTTNASVRTAHWQTAVAIAVVLGTIGLVIPGAIGWHVGLWAATTFACFYAAWAAKSTAMLYVANGTFVLLSILLCKWANLSDAVTTACVSWVGMVVLYSLGRLYQTWRGNRRVGKVMFVSGVVTALVAGIIAAMSDSQATVIMAGVALVAVGWAICYDDYESKRLYYVDLGAMIALAGLQRIIAVLVPGLDMLVYTHMWALLFLGLAMLYRSQGKRSDTKSRVVLALLIITFPLLLAAFTGSTGKQILFLIEHAAMVLIGLVVMYRVATIWGAIGVSFAVLYMLRGYTSFLTILIGLAIIAAVIWVITKSNKRPQPPT